MRLLIAAFTAPIVFGLLLLIVSLFLGNPAEGLWAVLFSSLIGYLIMIVIGLPAHMLLKKLGFSSLFSYLSASLVLSLIPIAYFVIYPHFLRLSQGQVYNSDVVLSSGLVLASLTTVIVFWVIVRPGSSQCDIIKHDH